MADTPRWESLPDPALETVAKKIVCVKDYIRFRMVCKNWHTITKDKRHGRTKANPYQLPLLLVASRVYDPSRRGLYSIPENRTYISDVQVVHPGRFCGSSHGWIIFTNPETSMIRAINPFSGITKDISPMFSDERIIKAVLSDSPDETSFAIMVIYGKNHKCAMLKSGDTAWTFFPTKQWPIEDVIFSKGKFLALKEYGSVFSLDINSNNLVTLEPAFAPYVGMLIMEIYFKSYIVESVEGDVLQVTRIFRDIPDEANLFWTISFSVFKRVCEIDGKTWLDPVQSLGENALFIGDNHSMSVSAMDFPGCQPNSIYYTDDRSGPLVWLVDYEQCGAYDMGVYNMAARVISRHYVPNEAQKFLAPPIWIIPTLKSHEG